ncbi:hypothetical protein PSHT_05447 [Puccinia striiformis]|uniref:Uncharacterized protein n=1 Tax=Puccinia striiformis TaxID=27350 RepID=A0A2S4WA94_9BASI|nr:hypothetical protein PSHT_05447 [Puccinia striiformis]
MAAAHHSNPKPLLNYSLTLTGTSQIIPILWHQETIINPMTIIENFDKSVDKCGRYNPLNES